MARKKYPVVAHDKKIFHAARKDAPKAQVQGYKVKVAPWLDGFVYYFNGSWWCCELGTGYALSRHGKTIQDAAKKARKYAIDMGHEWILAQLAKLVEAQESEKGGD